MNIAQSSFHVPATPWQGAVVDASLPAAGPELLVALDIDGTILHHNTSLSPRVKKAILTHLEVGTHVVIATGRGISGAQIAMQQLDYDHGYAVCSNGAIMLSVGDITPPVPVTPVADAVCEPFPQVSLIGSNTFDPSHEIDVIAKALPEAIMAVETLDQVRKITDEFPPGELTGDSRIVPVSELSDHAATRLTVRAPHLTATELLEAVNNLGLHGVEYAVGWSAWMDVAPEGISKAVGLEQVRKLLGVSSTATVAVGDSGNDCEMLAWAHLGIAMGNSPDYVASYAKAKTEDVAMDGCALILEALLD
ncbi:HAD family hydrolase [Arcanobacterium ihumii]|uniref:HAD family hydrolase n=1 Tax=Arcanobacterium ihumii TaxID=2138162 RepID=UPI001F204938|nr:HAD family hydrolase [Arcanobacterium ihumii]